MKAGFAVSDQLPDYILYPPEKYPLPDFSENPLYQNSRATFKNCPAYIQYFSGVYIIRSPISFTFRVFLMKDERYGMEVPQIGCTSEENIADTEFLNSLIQVHEPDEWYDIKKPVIQLSLAPFFFFADEECYMEQLPAFNHTKDSPLLSVPGVFNIHKWPRGMSLAYIWDDIEKPLAVKRGDPLCYLKFSSPKHKKVKLVECEWTLEMQKYQAALSFIKSKHLFSNPMQTLMQRSLDLRSKKWVKEKKHLTKMAVR